MELNFTGKGSAFYPPFKNTGAYMLSGKALYLIDCGETMFDVLYHKLDLASIEDVYVILTHMHADHVGSLGTLISYFYCLFNKAIHVVYPQETIKQLLTLEGITPLGYHYHETLPENPAGLTAVPVEVKHALDMKCYGYVLSDGTETIYYSGASLQERSAASTTTPAPTIHQIHPTATTARWRNGSPGKNATEYTVCTLTVPVRICLKRRALVLWKL